MKHGGNISEAARQYGYQPSEMIDLSTGISPRVYPLDMASLTAQRLRDLPQAEDEEKLKLVMRKQWAVPDSAEIVLSPGSGLLISLLPRLRPETKVMMPDPVYSEHLYAWQAHGHDVQFYQAGEIPHPAFPANIVAVQPGNPMGHCADPEDWQDSIANAAKTGGLVVMDEAFIDLMPSKSVMPFAEQKGLIILRSLGKFYGLAGLRLGAAIGHADDIKALTEMMGPWAVSTPALDLAYQALADDDWPALQRQWLNGQMQVMQQVLTDAGFSIIGGTDLYCLVEPPEADQPSGAFGDINWHQKLAQAGIWTRVFDHHPRWMRFGLPKDDAEMARLAKALKL